MCFYIIIMTNYDYLLWVAWNTSSPHSCNSDINDNANIVTCKKRESTHLLGSIRKLFTLLTLQGIATRLVLWLWLFIIIKSGPTQSHRCTVYLTSPLSRHFGDLPWFHCKKKSKIKKYGTFADPQPCKSCRWTVEMEPPRINKSSYHFHLRTKHGLVLICSSPWILYH